MSDELKLCPLCKDNRIEIEPYDNQGSLWCKGCGVLLTAKVFDAGMPDIEEKVKSSLAEIWNTRPIEDALRARIAELEEEIDQLTSHSNIERQDDNLTRLWALARLGLRACWRAGTSLALSEKLNISR